MESGRYPVRPHPRLGWLAAILPAGARRFRVRDSEFADAISAAGGELVDASPDVEIAPETELVGDASIAVVPVGVLPPRGVRPRPVRAARRLVDAASVGRQVAAVRRRVRRRGYDHAVAIAWEAQTKLVPTLDDASRVPLFQRFPRRAVVVCRRGPREPTALEAALADASRELDRQLGMPTFSLSSSGAVIATVGDIVLRVSLGPAARRLEDQRVALEALREAQPSEFVEQRVPWVLGTGSSGLARWSVEQWLPGHVWREPPEELRDCLDFLAELFLAHSGDARTASPAGDAEICADYFPEYAEVLRNLGGRLESALADLPRGFGHGDFWTGNLLAEEGRLVGVVDWPSAGPGRFPLLDLFHLRAQQVRERTGARLASVVTEQLLPQAGRGGHDLDRAYCRRLGLDLDSRDLENLLGAYWLEEVRHALIDPDRDPVEPTRPEWRRANVETLGAFARRCGLPEFAASER